MMNLQVQVTASLCLVLLVIQPALNHPLKSFTQLSLDETEHERGHANIRIIERETIQKSPICDCLSKITKLPAVTIQQAGGHPHISGVEIDVDDLKTPLGVNENEEELLVSKWFGKKLPAVRAKSSETVFSRLPLTRKVEIDADDFRPRWGANEDEEELLLRNLYAKKLSAVGEKSSQTVFSRLPLHRQGIRGSNIDVDDLTDEELLLLERIYKKYGKNLQPFFRPNKRIRHVHHQPRKVDIDLSEFLSSSQ